MGYEMMFDHMKRLFQMITECIKEKQYGKPGFELQRLLYTERLQCSLQWVPVGVYKAEL